MEDFDIFLWLGTPSRFRPPHCWGLYVTLRHTTFSSISLDEGSAHRLGLHLKIHNTQRGRLPCSWRDSNLQSQQANGCKPTP